MLRRLIITAVAMVVIFLSALGVESLVIDDHSSILRQTLTTPVERLINQPREDSNQVVVAIDNHIEPYLIDNFIAPTFDAINEAFNAEGKFLVLKHLDRLTIEDLLQDGLIDFLISGPDFYANLLFEDRVKPMSMLWRPQASSPGHSMASTIVVRHDNDKLYTLNDIAHTGVKIEGVAKTSFAGYLAAQDPFAKMDYPFQMLFESATFASSKSPLEVLNDVKYGYTDVGIVPACQIEYYMAKNLAHLSDFRVINPQPVDELACQHSTQTFSSIVLSYQKDTNANMVLSMNNIVVGMRLHDGVTWSLPDNPRSLYDMLYRLKLGPYSDITYSTVNRIFQENRMVFIMGIFLLVAGLFYNLIISVEVASRTRALQKTLTEKEALAKQQEQTNEYIARLERTGIVGQMSSMIAHELKQPLGTISNYTRGLLRRIERHQADEETIVKILKEIEYHNDRAADIVDHVRSYVKSHDVKREDHNLRDIVNMSVETFKKSGRSQVPVRIEGEREAWVEVDDWEVELALINLLKNSADAFAEVHPARYVEGECLIRVRIEDHDDTWWIRVIDNAKLVTKEFTDEFFTHLETTKAHGLGLGLSIVSSLAERHAGRVWAEPNVGRGVIVTIEFPKSISKLVEKEEN